MHRPYRRIITAIFLTILSVTVLLSAACAYLIVTPAGGKVFVHYFKQEFFSVGLMHIGHYEGTLEDGFVLKDITVKGLSHFPDALLRVQEVRVHLPLWDLPHSDFAIFNARIFIPDSDPVVFTGDISPGKIKGDLYAKSVDFHAATRFWATEDIRKNAQGFISDIDLTVQGALRSPHVSGHFLIDNMRYKSVTLTDGFSRLNMVLVPKADSLQAKGEIILDSGLVNVRNTSLELTPSKFIFREDIFNPLIDIHLGSKVEDMEVHLTIKGTSSDPQLTVTSDPPMSPQNALLVLFTGNAWSASTSPFYGVTSSELAQNFLNYSLQDINDGTQLGLKKKLTDNLKLGAEMDQMPSTVGQTNVYYYRRINGEMDLSEHMSLNVSRQFMAEDSYPSYEDAQPEDETQVYMQYKKRF